jgi:hypothetical protein
MTTTDTLRERVERGAKLLDEKDPGWAAKILIPALHMDDCRLCVLGQAFGDYTTGLKRMLGSNFRRGDEDCKHGFDIDPPDRTINSWTALEALWAEEIRRRTELRL